MSCRIINKTPVAKFYNLSLVDDRFWWHRWPWKISFLKYILEKSVAKGILDVTF